jgi:hypothetical protein
MRRPPPCALKKKKFEPGAIIPDVIIVARPPIILNPGKRPEKPKGSLLFILVVKSTIL